MERPKTEDYKPLYSNIDDYVDELEKYCTYLEKKLETTKPVNVDLADVSKSVCKMCGDLEQIYKEDLCMICYDDVHGM